LSPLLQGCSLGDLDMLSLTLTFRGTKNGDDVPCALRRSRRTSNGDSWVARDIAATASTGPRRPRLLPDAGAGRHDPALVRPILSLHAGVLRDGEGLRAAARALYPLAISQDAASDPAIAGLMIAIAAMRRRESRGARGRTDFPDRTNLARRSMLRLDDALQTARDFATEPVA